MVARMDVVSYWVWSTRKAPRRRGGMISVGIRVPGPHSSCGPLLLPCPGGGTWSHAPPNSSYVTTTIVSLRQALLLIADTRSTRWLLPRVSLVQPGCSFSSPTGLTQVTEFTLHRLVEPFARCEHSASSRRCARPAVPGA